MFFLPVIVLPLAGGEIDLAAAFGLSMELEAAWVFNGMMRVTPEGLTVAWPFVVDSNRYTADIRAHQR